MTPMLRMSARWPNSLIVGIIAMPRRFMRCQRQLGTFARAGVGILSGTHVGFLDDYDPGDEYALLAGAGLSWREVLASLTTAPAQRFGEAGRRGRIAPGLDADLALNAVGRVREGATHDSRRADRVRAGVVASSRNGRPARRVCAVLPICRGMPATPPRHRSECRRCW